MSQEQADTTTKHYVPLHVHTEFSLLDGAIKLKDYFEYAKEQGWKAIAITDHGNVFGAVKFFQLAKKYDIKPILGIEAYFIPDASEKNSNEKYYHHTILVQNEIGYKNLCRLIAFSYQKGFYFKPRIDFAALEEYNDGLIVLSGCLGGYVPKLLQRGQDEKAEEMAKKYLKVFGPERYYFEVMAVGTKFSSDEDRDTAERQQLVNEKLAVLGKKLGIKLVATPDSHYLLAEHKQAHEAMLAVGTKNLLTDKNRFSFGEFEGHLKTTDEMLSGFPKNPEYIWQAGQIADLCEFEFTFGKLMFPQYQVPEGFTQNSYFSKLCSDGLERLFSRSLISKVDRKKYEARLKLEVDMICQMGFAGYFLVVGDFIAWAQEQKIPIGPGRGSAAGVLAAWCLQITNIDPIKYGLLFERFLNPERVSMPDFDIDFCIERREEVINYVKDKYGHDAVCQIITFGTMAAKGVLKDVARVLSFSFNDSQAITDLVPNELKMTLKKALDQEPKLGEMISNNPKIKHLFDLCKVLEGLTRHASKHAAGVVISPEPLRNVLPMYIPPKTTDLVTQYAMTELEAVGFLKMDFLGLKNLTVIDRAVKAIKKRYGVELDLDKLPLDDAATYKTFCDGKTAGIFQFEGSGVTDAILKLQPEKFEDLIAMNALYRPGPLGSGMVDDFIDGRHGKKTPTYLFPELEPILAETYGVIVYQEQVMRVSSAIAGFSLGGADILRRAMGKKKVEVMAEQRTLFLEGAKKLGFDQAKAGKLFDLMAFFAGYGFNKSHSAAYALIAYQTGYLKTHYPKEFIAATLTFETSDPDKLQEYLIKAREMGVKVIQPDINESEAEFAAVDQGVRFGLQGVKNLGGAALEGILVERQKGKFESFYEFCKRVDLRKINKRVLESLIYAGAFDSLPGNRAQKLAKVEEAIAKAQQEKEAEKHGQVGLFNFVQEESDVPTEPLVFDALEELPLAEKLDKEKDAVGFYISSHPLDAYRQLTEWLGCKPLKPEEWSSEKEEKGQIIGLLQSLKTIRTKKGDLMAFAEVEDLYGSCEAVIFPKVYAQVETILEEGKIYYLSGFFEAAGGKKLKIKVNDLVRAGDMLEEKGLKWQLRLGLPQEFTAEHLEHLKQMLQPGESCMQLAWRENEQNFALTWQKKVAFESKILQKLANRKLKVRLFSEK